MARYWDCPDIISEPAKPYIFELNEHIGTLVHLQGKVMKDILH